MKFEPVKFKFASERRIRKGFRFGNIIVTGRTRNDAEKYLRRYRSNPNIKGLASSVRRFRQFNNKEPRALLSKKIDLSKPFIRVGKVPQITYMSDKEGKLTAYKHDTKVMPTMYAHPSKPILVIMGGSLKMRKWFHD